MSHVRLVEVFPALLGTYGDHGNAVGLLWRARLRGLSVETHVVHPGEAIPVHGDIYLLGGGEDGAQGLAATLLIKDGGLARAVNRGAAVLAVCAGMQMLGTEFPGTDGHMRMGLGLVDASTTRLARRAIGDLVVRAQVGSAALTLTGFENHRLGTELGPQCRPLGTVLTGIGNDDSATTEGLVQEAIIGTYLHGPVLALNPALADLLLTRVVGELAAVDPEEDAWATRARATRGGGRRWASRAR